MTIQVKRCYISLPIIILISSIITGNTGTSDNNNLNNPTNDPLCHEYGENFYDLDGKINEKINEKINKNRHKKKIEIPLITKRDYGKLLAKLLRPEPGTLAKPLRPEPGTIIVQFETPNTHNQDAWTNLKRNIEKTHEYLPNNKNDDGTIASLTDSKQGKENIHFYNLSIDPQINLHTKDVLASRLNLYLQNIQSPYTCSSIEHIESKNDIEECIKNGKLPVYIDTENVSKLIEFDREFNSQENIEIFFKHKLPNEKHIFSLNITQDP
jgi:hypothetical protein